MPSSTPSPEIYFLPPTEYVPNSPLPLLVYRDALPQPVTAESCQTFVEKHGWSRKGPVWKAIYRRHFHPNTHECYGILSGTSTVLMGVGTSDITDGRSPNDKDSTALGLRLVLKAGDMIVHPAGTSHANLIADDGYEYLSFFPNGSPHWKSDNGSKPMDLGAMRAITMAIPMPEDPVTGGQGSLHRLWSDAAEKFFKLRGG